MDIEKKLFEYALKGYKLDVYKRHGSQDNTADTWISFFKKIGEDPWEPGGIFDKTYAENLEKDKAIKSSIRKMKKHGYSY